MFVCVGDRVIAFHSGEHIGVGCDAMTYVTFLIAHSVGVFDSTFLTYARVWQCITCISIGKCIADVYIPIDLVFYLARYCRREHISTEVVEAPPPYEVLCPERVLCDLGCSTTGLVPWGFLGVDQVTGRRYSGLSARYCFCISDRALLTLDK